MRRFFARSPGTPGEVWDKVALLIGTYDPPKKTGRPRSDERDALNGVI